MLWRVYCWFPASGTLIIRSTLPGSAILHKSNRNSNIWRRNSRLRLLLLLLLLLFLDILSLGKQSILLWHSFNNDSPALLLNNSSSLMERGYLLLNGLDFGICCSTNSHYRAMSLSLLSLHWSLTFRLTICILSKEFLRTFLLLLQLWWIWLWLRSLFLSLLLLLESFPLQMLLPMLLLIFIFLEFIHSFVKLCILRIPLTYEVKHLLRSFHMMIPLDSILSGSQGKGWSNSLMLLLGVQIQLSHLQHHLASSSPLLISRDWLLNGH